jgi:hypothetical protein
LREASVYGNVDVQDGLQRVCWTRCGRDAGWGKWRRVKMWSLWQARWYGRWRPRGARRWGRGRCVLDGQGEARRGRAAMR